MIEWDLSLTQVSARQVLTPEAIKQEQDTERKNNNAHPLGLVVDAF